MNPPIHFSSPAHEACYQAIDAKLRASTDKQHREADDDLENAIALTELESASRQPGLKRLADIIDQADPQVRTGKQLEEILVAANKPPPDLGHRAFTCRGCGKVTKAEAGTVFTCCGDCFDKSLADFKSVPDLGDEEAFEEIWVNASSLKYAEYFREPCKAFWHAALAHAGRRYEAIISKLEADVRFHSAAAMAGVVLKREYKKKEQEHAARMEKAAEDRRRDFRGFAEEIRALGLPKDIIMEALSRHLTAAKE